MTCAVESGTRGASASSMRNPLLHGMAALLLFGCTGTFSGGLTTPSMVYIGPDVRVLADYDEPIFYTNDFYWRQRSGVWYRSSRHDGGWVVYSAPPAIRRIQRPSAYVHYRAVAKVEPRRHDNHRRNPPTRHEKKMKKHHDDRDRDHQDRGRDHDHHRDHHDRKD